MRCLEEIVDRNARAVVRAWDRAVAVGGWREADDIARANPDLFIDSHGTLIPKEGA